MISKMISKIEKYLVQMTVVAVALAMATTLSFADEEVVHQREYERLIAHGGGSVEGFETSSSVPALMQAIQNGFKMIELDMEFSNDNKIVMLHDWDRTLITYLGRDFDKPLTLKEFNYQLIYGKFEPLTFDKLTKILDKNPQVRILTDTKGDNIKLLTEIAEKYPAYIPQIIPQIYDYSEFEPVSALGYEDIIFTLYTQSTVDYSKLLTFIRENNIYAVTMPTNYWVKDLKKKLAGDGIVFYTHPVYTLEEAQAEIKNGAYGVYSSTLIPSELQGLSGAHYLMQTNEKGKKVKLTDITVKEAWIRTIKIHGNTNYRAFKYKLDGENLETALAEIKDSPSEKHDLDIEIWDISQEGKLLEEPIYTMKYTLTKNNQEVRILDKKYDYRLESLKPLPDFYSVMSEESKTKPTEKVVDILSKSFIAKAGEYYYYNEGGGGNYSVADELLFPQKSVWGNVMVPLAETITELGASSITMDASRYVYIHMGGNKFISQAYSSFLRRNTFNVKIAEPVSLYRSKAMSSGEFIFNVSGRSFVQGEDIMVILPMACTITENEQEKLIEAAELLYKHQEATDESKRGIAKK